VSQVGEVRAVTSTPSSPPSHSDTIPITAASGTTHEMSVFAAFLLLVFVALCFYCIVFSVYNYHVNGERGLGVLPHPNFWCDTLPTLVKDVCGRITELVQDVWGWLMDRWHSFRSSRQGGSAAEYERIREVRIVGHSSGHSNTGDANFYDVEKDADLDDFEDDDTETVQTTAHKAGSSAPPLASPASAATTVANTKHDTTTPKSKSSQPVVSGKTNKRVEE